MPVKLTRQQIKRKAQEFINCYSNRLIEQYLRISPMHLAVYAFSPEYYYFKVPKSKGGYREIEAPEQQLKTVQRKLNECLQYVYYTIKTTPAYGFIINPRKQQPKNIVTNARRHIGNDYMIKIDFDDFFHQIDKKRVTNIFKNKPFNFEKNTVNTLTKICTNKERLPMGAPSSPVLSNFACINLDNDLQKWTESCSITYTRFVDDLSFSSEKPITIDHTEKIKMIINQHQFRIEPTKTTRYGKQDEKTVTGIVVGEKNIKIADGFYKELNKDIDRLQKTMEMHFITGQAKRTEGLKKFKQEIMGKINFVANVMGYNSSIYEKYMQDYENALYPPNRDELSVRWLRFSNYSNF